MRQRAPCRLLPEARMPPAIVGLQLTTAPVAALARIASPGFRIALEIEETKAEAVQR